VYLSNMKKKFYSFKNTFINLIRDVYLRLKVIIGALLTRLLIQTLGNVSPFFLYYISKSVFF